MTRRHAARDAAIARRWAAGELRREICQALGLTDAAVAGALKRMRDRGEPIARRPTGPPPDRARRAAEPAR